MLMKVKQNHSQFHHLQKSPASPDLSKAEQSVTVWCDLTSLLCHTDIIRLLVQAVLQMSGETVAAERSLGS